MRQQQIRTVSCLGSGNGTCGDQLYEAMVEVGQILAGHEITVVTGAFGGVEMEAPCRGANSNGGETVGYTIQGKPGNVFLTRTVDCQALGQNIPFFADFGIRLSGLLASDGFIIATGGGIGTFLEFIAICLFNQKIWSQEGRAKRVSILSLAGRIGWDQDMLTQLRDWNLLDDERLNLIRVVTTPQEAVDWLLQATS